MDVVWIALFVAVLVGMWWFAYRMDPHWSAKDGTRFLCMAQLVLGNQPSDRFRETNVVVLPDGTLHVTRKRLARRQKSMWRLVGKGDTPPKGKVVFLARQVSGGVEQQHELLALKIPEKSRVVPVLEAKLEEQRLSREAQRRGTAAPADPPDRG